MAFQRVRIFFAVIYLLFPISMLAAFQPYRTSRWIASPHRHLPTRIHPHYYKNIKDIILIRLGGSSSGSGSSSNSAAPQVIRTLEPGTHVAEMEVKKSRFIGYAKNVDNWEDAKGFIDTVKQEHPKARHWCFGFQCGFNPVQARSSDDGEPTGTAGAPILGAINGEDLSDVACVVVRYFGGVKLGAGGLIRAYGGAARLVLREAPVMETLPKASFSVSVDSTYVGAIYGALAEVGALPSAEEYGADGSFSVSVTCELDVLETLQTSLTDATKGTVKFSDDS